MGKIKIKCDACGKEFEKYESKLGKNNFCCRECYLKFHSKEVSTYTCETCKKIFKGNKYNANRFCCRECYLQYHEIKNKQRECPKCKKIFIAKSSEDKYCSWECYNSDRHMPKGSEHWNWKGGISKENVLPFPYSLSTRICPFIKATSCLEIASPKPLPSILRLRLLSTC